MHQLHVKTEEAVDVDLIQLTINTPAEQDSLSLFQEAKRLANASNISDLAEKDQPHRPTDTKPSKTLTKALKSTE